MATDYQSLLTGNPWLSQIDPAVLAAAIAGQPAQASAPAQTQSSPYPGYTFQPLSPAEQQQLTQTLGAQGVNATDGGRFVDANGNPMLDASGQPYVMDQYGHDLGWQNMVAQQQNNDAQNNTRGLDLTLLGIAGGTAAGLATLGSGAAAGLGSAGAVGGGGAGSAAGGAGTVLTPLGGTAPITGTAIDVAGNAIGAPTLFGTSSIPFDGGAIAGGLGSIGSAASGAGAGAGSAASPSLDPGGAYSGIQDPTLSGLAGAGVASNIPSWLSALGPYAGLIGAGLGLVDSALQPDSTTKTAGGTSNSTNTSSLQLPSQLTGAAGTALDRANQLLGQGQQFAPMPYGINKAAGDLATLGTNNAPTTSSFASGANINPYLDLTFNAAADATQNRLGSEFANAGQYGSPQNQQSRSQQLQQLAAGIYGPGYQNAQNLQYGAQEAGVQRGLTQQDSNLNRTIQASQAALPIGQYMQQQQQAQLSSPYTNLNQYIGQLGGLAPYFPGTTQQSQATNQTGNVTQPLYNNPISSAAGGAVLGNYIGGLFGPQQPQQQGNAYTGMQTPQNMQIQPFAQNPYAYM